MQTYGPAEIEAHTGWHGQGQRDLRHKGYLSLYGTQSETGRWKYSRLDLVAFWVAAVLHEKDRGHNLEQIFGIAHGMAGHVLAHLDGKPAANFQIAGYQVESVMGGRYSRGWEVVTCNTIAEVSAKNFLIMEVTDLRHFASLAGNALKEALG